MFLKWFPSGYKNTKIALCGHKPVNPRSPSTPTQTTALDFVMVPQKQAVKPQRKSKNNLNPNFDISIREFPKKGGPYCGVLMIRVLLFRVLKWGPLSSETPITPNLSIPPKLERLWNAEPWNPNPFSPVHSLMLCFFSLFRVAFEVSMQT